jgi:hypothetical protein
MEHGEWSMYTHGKCRCKPCTAANREQTNIVRAAMRARGKADPTLIPHGTPSAYANWGCRCMSCKQAHSDGMQRAGGRKALAAGVKLTDRQLTALMWSQNVWRATVKMVPCGVCWVTGGTECNLNVYTPDPVVGDMHVMRTARAIRRGLVPSVVATLQGGKWLPAA